MEEVKQVLIANEPSVVGEGLVNDRVAQLPPSPTPTPVEQNEASVNDLGLESLGPRLEFCSASFLLKLQTHHQTVDGLIDRSMEAVKKVKCNWSQWHKKVFEDEKDATNEGVKNPSNKSSSQLSSMLNQLISKLKRQDPIPPAVANEILKSLENISHNASKFDYRSVFFE